MVLAMHIAGDGSTHGDKFCTGCHRQKPSLREKSLYKIGQCDPGLEDNQTGLGAEVENTVETAGHENPRSYFAVAIGTGPSLGVKRSMTDHGLGRLPVTLKKKSLGVDNRIAAPSTDFHIPDFKQGIRLTRSVR